MNKFISFQVLMAMIFFAMTGCNKDKPESDATGIIPVNLTADIGVKTPSSLKVANDQWEAADLVGLFMKRAGQALDAPAAIFGNANNVEMSIGAGGALIPATPFMYPEAGNVDFVAYYPYTASPGAGLTLPVNVAEQTATLPVEVLYSNNAVNQAPVATAVPLTFRYSLAKIVLTVTTNEHSPLTPADFDGMTVGIEGMYAQANLKLADGDFTGHQNRQTIMMHRTGNTASSASFSALVLPTGEEAVFVINAGGNTFRYPLTRTYAAHTCYTFGFRLNFPEIVAVLLSSNILPRDEEEPENFEVNTKQMTMTTAKEGEVTLYLEGTGTWSINWGDGTPSQTYTTSVPLSLPHTYTDATARTITITGDVTYLNCSEQQITALDVSKNTALTELGCDNNQLSSLDMSKNTALTDLRCDNNQLYALDVSNTMLTYLECQSNQFDATGLNELFGTLNGNTGRKEIYIANNPGTSTCDKSIATAKGWQVDTFFY